MDAEHMSRSCEPHKFVDGVFYSESGSQAQHLRSNLGAEGRNGVEHRREISSGPTGMVSGLNDDGEVVPQRVCGS